jgi:hypothetical protein
LSPEIITSLIALAGVLVGLVARDVVMATYLARKKRADDLADQEVANIRAHSDLVRIYSDPLLEAVKSLKFRLYEIIELKQGFYLHLDTSRIPFLRYKRISTLYRIASLLGWIRAIRRERSYLDPEQALASVEMSSILALEAALADGAHVELQRFDELARLWCVSGVSDGVKSEIANLIDNARAKYLSSKNVLSAYMLSDDDRSELAEICADIVCQRGSVQISTEIVSKTARQASIVFGIKEAYIYRYWQAAIGDMVIEADKSGGARHFTVIGFGAFEDMFLEAEQEGRRPSYARWFDRLEALVRDLDMTHESVFDARREQLRKIYKSCEELEGALAKRSVGRSSPPRG